MIDSFLIACRADNHILGMWLSMEHPHFQPLLQTLSDSDRILVVDQDGEHNPIN